MPDNEVNLNFKATGIDSVKGASEALKDYKFNLNAAEKANLSIASSTLTVNQRLDELKRASDIQGLGYQFGSVAKDVDSTKQAVKDLVAELKKLGATKEEILAASNAFQQAKENAQQLTAASGSTGGGGFSLSRVGGQLRSLPSTAIPGTGLTTDAVANVIRLGGAFQQVASNSDGLTGKAKEAAQAIGYGTIGMVGGIAILIGVTKIFTDQAEKARAAAQTEIDARQKAIGLLATATREEQQARINELATERAKNQAIADDANKTLAILRQQIDATGKNQLALAEFNASVGTGAGELKAAKEAAEKANKTLNGTTTELDLLQQGSGLTAQSLADVAQAQKDYNESLKLGARIIQLIESPLDKAKELNDFLATATTKQLEDKRKEVNAEIDLNSQKTVQLIEQRNKLDESSQAYKDIDAEIDKLRDSGDLLIQEIVGLNDVTAEAAAKENDLKEVRKEQIASTQKYNEDIQKLEDDKNKALADSTAKYNDNLVKLADTAATAAENALSKLKEKREDLATSFTNNEADAYTKAHYKQLDDLEKFQRTDAKAARDHANDLLKIQKDQYDKEQDLILNRDFAGLYALQRSKQKEIDAANSTYDTQRQDRLDAFAQQEADAAEQFKRDEDQRQVNYKRQQDQAALAFNREQAQITKNYNDNYAKAVKAYIDEQNLLNAKYQSQLSLRQQAITAELQLEAQGNQAKLNLEAQYYQQSQQLIKGIYSNGGSTAKGGGSIGTGWGGLSDYGNSSSLDMPQSYSSTSSSSVSNNNSKNVSVNLNQNISGGMDAHAIAQAAAQAAKQAIIDLVS